MKCISTLLAVCILLFTACGKNSEVISGVDERDANLIVVFLNSKGIPAQKVATSSGPAVGAQNAGPLFSIHVKQELSTQAMAILNQNGLPQRQGVSMLDLFAKQGLTSTEKEETIRYHAGLQQQITNTLLMMDGIIGASVQLSFPPEDALGAMGTQEKEEKKITASVYVKHQGVLEDPNTHLDVKIKRLVSGAISGLDINDVTVVSDWSRFTDVKPELDSASLSTNPQDYISIWSIILSKGSVPRFRSIFFGLLITAILLALMLAWFIWKFYHVLKQEGMKSFFHIAPFIPHDAHDNSEPEV